MNRSKQPDTMSLDKIAITAEYDDNGRCRSLDIRVNHDEITPNDILDAIRAAFLPIPAVVTMRDPGRDLGSAETEIIPVIERRFNSDGHRLDPGETTTRLTISVPR